MGDTTKQQKKSDSPNPSSNLPNGLQITPSRFIVLSKNQPNSVITIENLTYTTFAVYIKAPNWINCQRKFMVETKSKTELEILTNLTKANLKTQNLNDKIKLTFIDMSNKNLVYSTKVLLEYTNYSGQNLRTTEAESSKTIFLLQLSIILLILSILILIYHYRFQEKFYLCVFQSTLCELSRPDTNLNWFKRIFRCC